MRPQDFNAAMEALPSRIANFDEDGIKTAIGHIDAGGLLPQFAAAIRSSVPNAKVVISQVWMIPTNFNAIMADAAKVANIFNQTIGQLSPSPTPQQVVTAVVSFFISLFH